MRFAKEQGQAVHVAYRRKSFKVRTLIICIVNFCAGVSFYIEHMKPTKGNVLEVALGLLMGGTAIGMETNCLNSRNLGL